MSAVPIPPEPLVPETALPETMTVPRFAGQGAIEFGPRPVPRPGPGELLVRVRANALCGSERGQFYHGSSVTPGHEAAGVVAAVGAGTRTSIGTPGVIFLMDFCGECRSCALGLTNQCLAKLGDMGFNRDGGYGQYELISESIFFPVDPDLALDEATLLLDIMGTGGHALKRASRVHPDIESMVIAGAGPIGLGVLAMARILLDRAIPIFISDLSRYRLALAEAIGGTPLMVAEKSMESALREYDCAGVDLAIDTSGKAAARQSCLDSLAQRGVLVCVGHGETLQIEVSRDLIGPERTVMGSEYFCYDELPENLELLRTHRSLLSQIITHRFPVSEIRQAFELFFGGSTGKVVIEQ